MTGWKTSDIPPHPEGWRCGVQLAKEGYAADHSKLDRKLKELREILIQDIEDAGIPEYDAEAIVEHNLVGTRKSRKGHVAVYASPEAVALLGLRQRDPPAPKGWESAHSLSLSDKWRRRLGKSSAPAINHKLEKLRAYMIDDIVAAGYSQNEAATLVDHNLIGRRRGKHGTGALYASPEAIAMLEEPQGWRNKVDDTSSRPNPSRGQGGLDRG